MGFKHLVCSALVVYSLQSLNTLYLAAFHARPIKVIKWLSCVEQEAGIYVELMKYFSLHFAVEKKKETITESAGRQQKKKIGKIRRGVQCPENRGAVRKQFSFPSKVVLELALGPLTGSEPFGLIPPR